MSSIKRLCHIIKPEKSLAIPRHVIFFDCETTAVDMGNGVTEHRLKLGWACYYRKAERNQREKLEWLYFTKASVFWQFVLRYSESRNRLWIIAHKISFDFTVAKGFYYLKRAGFRCRFFYSGGQTTLIKVKRKGESIMFVDSLNWFRESLAEIGDRIGIPKQKIDFENCTFAELKAYCKVDVLILLGVFKQLARFLESNRISRLCYTIGSTAMAAYLFRHYRTKIHIHNNAQAVALERAAYKGGRTECFFVGQASGGPFYLLDVNSLYPFVMRDNLFPVHYERLDRSMSVEDLADQIESRSVVAQVSVLIDHPAIAVRDERTIFPIGKYTVTVSTPEIRYLLDRAEITEVHKAVIYKQADIFKSFVERFYALRCELKASNNPLFEHFCKIIMNSLYGKFGQKTEQWKKIADCPGEPDRIEDVIDIETRRSRRLRYLLGELHEMIGYTESINSFPAIAAHVTAFARMHLWRLLEIVGRRECFYCDTDSLFVSKRGLELLADHISENELGKLKLESVSDTLVIYGLKDYMIDDKTVIKGVRHNAIKLTDIDYLQDTFPTLTGLLRRGVTGVYQTRLQPKHLERTFAKGVIGENGFVDPFYLHGFVEPY